MQVIPDLFQVELKKQLGKVYKSTQSEGFNLIANKFFASGFKDVRHLAYILATALHETAFTMKPITEYGSKSYLTGKKYYPFVGRGYVQLTWSYNYEKYGIKSTPEKALEPERAAFIIVDGMQNGIFTGKKLSQYFNNTVTDAVSARRIVNGTDKAYDIAGYYDSILKAINDSLGTEVIEVTQRYGDDDAFVRAFQSKFGLVVDGNPGRQTWAMLNDMIITNVET